MDERVRSVSYNELQRMQVDADIQVAAELELYLKAGSVVLLPARLDEWRH